MEQNQILSAEDLNTQINVMESLSIIKGVEQRLQDELRLRFMAPYDGYTQLEWATDAARDFGKEP